jgi:hypothetical protein
LQHVPERFHLVVILGRECDLPFGALELDAGGRAFEIVPLSDLFLRLIHGVVDLLEVNTCRHVEGSLLCHARNLMRR